MAGEREAWREGPRESWRECRERHAGWRQAGKRAGPMCQAWRRCPRVPTTAVCGRAAPQEESAKEFKKRFNLMWWPILASFVPTHPKLASHAPQHLALSHLPPRPLPTTCPGCAR